MCGIVGYIGAKDPVEVLVEGLRRLEYRGYDSAGVAVVDGQEREAAVARLQGVREETADPADDPLALQLVPPLQRQHRSPVEGAREVREPRGVEPDHAERHETTFLRGRVSL